MGERERERERERELSVIAINVSLTDLEEGGRERERESLACCHAAVTHLMARANIAAKSRGEIWEDENEATFFVCVAYPILLARSAL